jgi:hypothetical protein
VPDPLGHLRRVVDEYFAGSTIPLPIIPLLGDGVTEIPAEQLEELELGVLRPDGTQLVRLRKSLGEVVRVDDPLGHWLGEIPAAASATMAPGEPHPFQWRSREADGRVYDQGAGVIVPRRPAFVGA